MVNFLNNPHTPYKNKVTTAGMNQAKGSSYVSALIR
jgi:hypothetical protein